MIINRHTEETEFEYFRARTHLHYMHKHPADSIAEDRELDEQEAATFMEWCNPRSKLWKCRDSSLQMIADDIYDILTDGHEITIYDYEEIMRRVDALVRAGAILKYEGDSDND